jgi:hypothetical protein
MAVTSFEPGSTQTFDLSSVEAAQSAETTGVRLVTRGIVLFLAGFAAFVAGFLVLKSIFDDGVGTRQGLLDLGFATGLILIAVGMVRANRREARHGPIQLVLTNDGFSLAGGARGNGTFRWDNPRLDLRMTDYRSTSGGAYRGAPCGLGESNPIALTGPGFDALIEAARIHGLDLSMRARSVASVAGRDLGKGFDWRVRAKKHSLS